MTKLPLILGAALAALAVSGAGGASAQAPLLITTNADASTAQLIFGRDVAGDASLQQAQFFFSGRNYCFYDNGWRGPGFYWCGYAFRRGYGWGGPVGWHGWSGGGYHGGGGYRGGGYRGGGGYHGGGNVHINNSVHQNVHVSGGGFHGGGGHAGGGGGHGGGGHGGGGDHHH